jgi:hypothetical protein
MQEVEQCKEQCKEQLPRQEYSAAILDDTSVIPAQAGIQSGCLPLACRNGLLKCCKKVLTLNTVYHWIPACAGMTELMD